MSNPVSNLFNESEVVFNLPLNKISLIFQTICQEHEYRADWINVILMTNEDHNSLNLNYLAHSDPTDVLTFSFNEGDSISGEIYINVRTAEINSIEYGNSFRDEIKRLIIHGMLHLVGYNDASPNEREEMHKLENHYLKSFM